MRDTHAVPLATTSWPLRHVMAAIFGAALVAVSAQVAVPIPGTPIPLTLQVPAVLIVGGLLGPRVGAASMVAYLLAGMAGLPVFAPGSTLGMARLLGPTGGYLLAFPIAAAIVGAVTSRRGGGTIVAAAMGLGFVTIHIGGIAQLAVVTGDIRTAFLWGSLPFLVGDAIKLTLAGLLVWRFGPITRARL